MDSRRGGGNWRGHMDQHQSQQHSQGWSARQDRNQYGGGYQNDSGGRNWQQARGNNSNWNQGNNRGNQHEQQQWNLTRQLADRSGGYEQQGGTNIASRLGGRVQGNMGNDGAVTKEQLEEVLAKIARADLAAGQHVSAATLMARAAYELGYGTFDELGFDAKQVPMLDRLLQLENRVATMIGCFAAQRSVATLCDLEDEIVVFEKVHSFEDLRLGPLVRHPMVQRYFSPDTYTNETPDYTLLDFANDFLALTNQNKTRERMDPKAILAEVAALRGITDPRQLGVRINKLGFVLSVCSQVRQSEATLLPKLKAQRAKELESQMVEEWRVKLLDMTAKPPPDRPGHAALLKLYAHGDKAKRKGKPIKHSQLLHWLENEEIVTLAAAWLGVVHEDKKLADEEAIYCLAAKHYEIYSNFMERCDEIELLNEPWAKRHAYLKKAFDDAVRSMGGGGKKGNPKYTKMLTNPVVLGVTLLATCYANSSKCPERAEENCTSVDLVAAVVRQVQDYTPDDASREDEATKGGKPKSPWETLLSFLNDIEHRTLRRFGKSIFNELNDNKYSFLRWIRGQEALIVVIEEYAQSVGIRVMPATKNEKPESKTGAKKRARAVGAGEEGDAEGTVTVDLDTLVDVVGEMMKKEMDLADEILGLFERLERVESAVCKRFGVADFKRLGHGSILHLVCMNPALSEISAEFSDIRVDSGWISLEEIASVLVRTFGLQTVISSGIEKQEGKESPGDDKMDGVEGVGTRLGAMERVLCGHYGVDDVKSLGYGVIGRLVRRVAAYVSEHNVNTSDTVCYAASLTLLKNESGVGVKQENEVGEGGMVGMLGEVSVEMGMNAIGRAPNLLDLSTCTQWDVVFAPSLGKLPVFVLANTSALERHGVQLLATGPQSFIKVQPDATPDSYLETLKQGHPSSSAAHLCGVVVGAGHVTEAPLNLLGLHTHTAALILASPVNMDGSIDSAMGMDAGKHRACQVIFDVIRALPPCLQSALTMPVLLGPLRKAIPDAPRIILSLVAQDPVGLALVHRLGLSHHIDTWATHYHDTYLGVTSPVTASKPLARLETATDSGRQQQTEHTRMAVDGADSVHVDASMEEDGGHAGKAPDAPEDSAQEAMDESSARALIETIRRERFGRGVDLSEPLGTIVGQQNAMIARALGRLSRDLYSRDSHFVLELVQNADDNTYPEYTRDENNVNPPTVWFEVHSDRIVVMNNEKGFTARDMQALCDVGNSTKSGQTAGYIGQKGIGFKSVFRVSNRPEIHSGGFHVKFDRDSEEMGYVLPTWIEPSPNADRHPQWSTTIILPLTNEMVRRRGELVQQFGDLHPSVLLFLHRLQRIVVADDVAGTVCTMTRRTLPSGYMQVNTQQTSAGSPPTSTTATWMLVRHTHPVRDGLREGVSITEVTLAFPSLGDEISPSTVGNRPPQQPVFAFLPLRSYGLRFVVQGDFILPSSREDVDVDSPWNQWLRGLITPLFLEGMQKMKAEGTRRSEEAKRKAASRPRTESVVLGNDGGESDISEGREEEEEGEVKGTSGKRQRKRKGKQNEEERTRKRRKGEEGGKEETGHEGGKTVDVRDKTEVDGIVNEEVEWDDGMTATYMLQFVPLEGEVTGFFRPLVREILHGLRGLECVHTANGGWAVPSQVVFLEDREVYRLISATDIHRYLGLFTLHPSCHLGPALRSALGIETFGPGHLMKLVHMRLDSTRSTTQLDPTWVANWLCALYRSLDRLTPTERSNIISGLKQLPLIPLASGEWTSVSEGAVFLPMRDRGSEFGSEHSLQVVRKDMFSKQERVGESMVVDMLVAVGVNRPTPDRVIANHILPAMARLDPDGLRGFDPKLAAAYALYLRSNHGWDAHHVRDVLIVATSKGCMRLAGHAVFFPSGMGNAVAMPEVLPTHMEGLWPVLASAYLQADGSVANWRQFFQLFGVQDFPVPEQTRRVMKAPLPSPWADIPELAGLAKDAQVTIGDFHCPSLQTLLQSATSTTTDRTHTHRCMVVVIEALQDGWDHTYSPAMTAHVNISESTGERIFTVPSTFARALKDIPWVPSSDGKARMGCELYGPNTTPYFGEGEVPTPLVKLSKGLASAVGLVEEVSAGMMASALLNWAKNGVDGYVSSVQRMVAVYKLLAQAPSTQPDVVCMLANQQVIWLPTGTCTDPSTPTPGHFHRASDVCLKDPSGLLNARGLMREATRAYRHYPASHLRDSDVQAVLEFFESLGILATPPTDRYLSALETICQEVTAEARKHVFSILGTWATPLAEGHMTPDDVARLANEMKTRNTPFLLTKANMWVSLATPDTYLVDDQTVGMRFERVSGVSLVELPPPEKETAARLRALCLALGMPLLSKSVRCSVHPTAARFDTPWAGPLKNAIAVVQRYIYTRYPTRYRSLVESGQGANLAKMTFGESPGMDVVWMLGNNNVNQSNVACVVDNTTVYINTNYDKGSVLYDAIGRELSRVFSAGKVCEDVATFVAYFLASSMDRAETHKWLAARDIPELPDSEMPWVEDAFPGIADDPIVIDDDSAPVSTTNVPHPHLPHIPDTHPPEFTPHMPAPQSDHHHPPPARPENEKGEERSWQPQVGAGQTQETAGVQDVFLQPVTVRATDIRLPGRPTSETAHAIGRWGEECVFGLLVKQQAGKGEVVWVNREKESGLPYDVLVTAGGATTYVEVKSTTSWDRVTFNLSEREFRMAERHGQRFAVALVHGAGESGARVRIFRDPAQRWRNGDLEMLMYVPSVAKQRE